MVQCGGIVHSCCGSTVEVAITDAAYHALPSGEAPGSDEDTAPPVYFMLHMLRTGGTTIAGHLKAHLGDRMCATVRPSPLEMLGRRRVRLYGAPDFRHVRVVTGHYLGRSLERHFPGQEIRRTLLLRDPIGFHVSYYNYLMMFSLSRGGPTCSFERHLRIQPRDMVPLMLLLHWLEMPLRTILATGDARKYALLNESLAGFWFVGSYEDGDRLLAAVAADLGLPTRAARKNTTAEWRNRSAWQPLRENDLSDATRRAILAKNPIHDALWHGWRDAGFGVARHASRAGSFPSLAIPRSSRGRVGSGWRSCGGELGFRDLARSVLADRFIAPIWWQISWASKARDWPRAVRLYRKALRRVPDAAEVWVQYGHALNETDDIAGAAAAYRCAVELAPEMAERHLFLGQALVRQGRMDEARAVLLRAEQLDPALLRQKQEELVARGHSPEEVAAYWRALTGGVARGQE